MDIPLSSDALDLALHPSASTNLLAVGLISGKVQLLDLARYEEETQLAKGSQSARRRRGKKRREEPEDEDEEEEVGGKVKGKEKKLYEKKWTKRYNNKSCRGVEYNHGECGVRAARAFSRGVAQVSSPLLSHSDEQMARSSGLSAKTERCTALIHQPHLLCRPTQAHMPLHLHVYCLCQVTLI